MTVASATWKRARVIFLDAVRMPGPDRERAVRERCANDPELASAVRALLEGHDMAEGPLDRLAADIGASVGRQLRGGAQPETAVIDPPAQRYQVIRDLGRGGMGVVRLARDTSLNRLVAIKTVDPAVARSRLAKRQLLREARMVAALDHPNIVAIHEVGLDEQGALFLVLAYSEGETLKARLDQEPPLSGARALEIALAVARALVAAHRAGIVHRDIKPSNILLSEDGAVKLTDFGIADRQGPRRGLPGPQGGTPAYMSPEQRRGEPVDHRTDLWSLGCVLYEMITGVRYDPEAGSTSGFGRSQAADVAWALVESILSRALEPSPSQRYQRAEEMLADLECAIPGEPRFRARRRKRPIGSPLRATVVVLVLTVSLMVTADIHRGSTLPRLAPGVAGRLLWVDDYPRGNVEETRHLASLGFEISHASSTADALTLYDPSVFDLVITDLGRMEENEYDYRAGLNLLSRLREIDPGVPVIFFTSPRAAEVSREQIMNAGAEGIAARSSDLYELVLQRR